MQLYIIYRKISKVFNWIFNICAIALFALSIFTVIQYKSNSLDSNIFGYKIMFIGSGSMEPNIREKSIVLVKKYEGQELKKDDIVTFVTRLNEDDKNTKVVVTHRIYKVNDDGTMITKGDNNTKVDGIPITKDDVHFTYVKVFNQTAKLCDIWQTTNGKVMIICAILFFVFLIIAYNSFIAYLDEKFGYIASDMTVKQFSAATNNDDSRFLIKNQGFIDNQFNYLYIDRATGVQYMLINTPSGVALSILYDKEGNPIIYDFDSEETSDKNEKNSKLFIPHLLSKKEKEYQKNMFSNKRISSKDLELKNEKESEK